MRTSLLGFLLATMALSGARAEPTKISLGYVLAGDFITSFVAKDKGFFDQHGLDVQMVKVPLATSIPPALVSGSLDIGMSTATIVVQTASGGLDLVTIAGVSRFFADTPKVALVGKTGTAYHSASDMRGKTIGVPGIGSAMDIGVKMWLKQNHIAITEVNFVESSFPQQRDMLMNRSIDAVATLEPFLSRIVGSGDGYRIANYFAEVAPNALSAVWISTGDWAKAHPDVITRFRESLADAFAFIQAHPDDTKPIEQKYLGYTSPVKPSISLIVQPHDYDFYNTALLDLGLIDHSVDVAKLVIP